MKDCYKVVKKTEVCGTLDVNDDGVRFLRIEVDKEDDPMIIPLDEILDALTGQKISIKSDEEYYE